MIRAYQRMLPALRAEESLLAIRRIAIGSGAMERHDAMRIVNRWVQAAHRTEGRAVKATPSHLQGARIGLRFVPRSREAVRS